MFHVGQLVKCIKDFEFHPRVTMPTKGTCYTVRQVFLAPEGQPRRPGEQFVRVAEIHNAPWSTSLGPFEPAWHYTGFSPLDDSRLEIFRKALRTVPVEGEPVA